MSAKARLISISTFAIVRSKVLDLRTSTCTLIQQQVLFADVLYMPLHKMCGIELEAR
jgi:hypothetical protein